jgi:hypothetical protein
VGSQLCRMAMLVDANPSIQLEHLIFNNENQPQDFLNVRLRYCNTILSSQSVVDLTCSLFAVQSMYTLCIFISVFTNLKIFVKW